MKKSVMFNINSPKQLGEALFGKLGWAWKKKTKEWLFHKC